MGLIRNRMARQRRAQRNRAVAEAELAGNAANPALARSMSRHGAGDVASKTIKKLIVYGFIFAVMQYSKRNKKEHITSGAPVDPIIMYHYNLPTTTQDRKSTDSKGVLYVVDHVLPEDVASRWRKTMQLEWYKTQHGAWEYCSTVLDATKSSTVPTRDLECHKSDILKRNGTIHSSINTSKALESSWALPSDNYQVKALRNNFYDRYNGVAHDKMIPLLRRMMNLLNEGPDIEIEETDDFILSHFSTGDFRQNFDPLPVRTRPTLDPYTIQFSFALLLNEEGESLIDSSTEENDKANIKSTDSIKAAEYGGVVTGIVCVSPQSRNDPDDSGLDTENCEQKDKVEIILNYNQAVFWMGSTNERWSVSEVSQLAEEHGHRMFFVSGSFYVRTSLKNQEQVNEKSSEL